MVVVLLVLGAREETYRWLKEMEVQGRTFSRWHEPFSNFISSDTPSDNKIRGLFKKYGNCWYGYGAEAAWHRLGLIPVAHAH